MEKATNLFLAKVFVKNWRNFPKNKFYQKIGEKSCARQSYIRPSVTPPFFCSTNEDTNQKPRTLTTVVKKCGGGRKLGFERERVKLPEKMAVSFRGGK